MNDERQRRIKELMDALMQEIGDEVVTPETLELLEKNLRKHITAAGLEYKYATIQIFLKGFEFCLGAIMNMGPQEAATMQIAMQKILRKLQEPNLKAVEDAMTRTKDNGEHDKK